MIDVNKYQNPLMESQCDGDYAFNMGWSGSNKNEIFALRVDGESIVEDMRKKLLFKEDKELYRKWATEFIRIYQDDNKRLQMHEVWFEVKVKEEGYEIRYDNAAFDFWDVICELTS